MNDSFQSGMRFYGVELVCREPVATQAWYCRVLGARSLVRVAEDGYYLLELAGLRIALLSGPPDGAAAQPVRLVFEMDDLEPLGARVRDAGWPVESETVDAEGLRRLKLRDPEGNALLFFSWPSARTG